MLPAEKMSWLGQTSFEHYRKKGFPNGCLDNVCLCGIKIEEFPNDFRIRGTRIIECSIQNVNLDSLRLSGCIVGDCIVSNVQIKNMDLKDATIYGTLFTTSQIGVLDIRGTTMRKSSIRDCGIEAMHVGGAELNGTYFYRMRPQVITGQESLHMTLGGAADGEVEHYKHLVKSEIF